MTTVSPAPNSKLRTSPLPTRQFWLERFRASWDATLDAFVPIGFEDNRGFHYGPAPSSDDNLPQNCQRP